MSETRKLIPSPPAYRVAALAERWQCSSGHIYGLIRDGKLNAFKVGKLLRVRAEEVERIETPPPIAEQPPAKGKPRAPDIWIPPDLPPGARRK
jgi:excisionase family DNA binding protein